MCCLFQSSNKWQLFYTIHYWNSIESLVTAMLRPDLRNSLNLHVGRFSSAFFIPIVILNRLHFFQVQEETHLLAEPSKLYVAQITNRYLNNFIGVFPFFHSKLIWN